MKTDGQQHRLPLYLSYTSDAKRNATPYKWRGQIRKNSQDIFVQTDCLEKNCLKSDSIRIMKS